MFSLEDRTRAVELYVKYGKKAAPVIRELGYPCRATLVAWYRKWERCGGNLTGRSLERYREEQKRAAVDQICHTANVVPSPDASSAIRSHGLSWLNGLARLLPAREDTPSPESLRPPKRLMPCRRSPSEGYRSPRRQRPSTRAGVASTSGRGGFCLGRTAQ